MSGEPAAGSGDVLEHRVRTDPLDYVHVDVFATEPFSGNSLPVFVDQGPLSTAQMVAVTQELRHFEAVFVSATQHPDVWDARIFDLVVELPFAGHPLIGAAAVLHRASGSPGPRTWTLRTRSGTVPVRTQRTPTGYFGVLDQGRPVFGGTVADRATVAAAFGLTDRDLHEHLPVTVVSTGLRYVVVPVRHGALDRARVAFDLTPLVTAAGADFAVLLDNDALEIRHWNNDGIIEDIATGSAAGTVGAYRLRHGLTDANSEFSLNQGRHVGRPSALAVTPYGTPEDVQRVVVGGPVSFVGTGSIRAPV